ncbi:MAG: ATP-dependent DNA helicase, partial [bacterium]
GLEIGLDTGYTILTYSKQWLLIRKNLFDFELDYYRPLGNPTKFISAMLKFISRLQDEGISDQDFSKFAQEFSGDATEKSRWQELAAFYKKYQELKLAHSFLDFGDLILWCLKLFTERTAVLKKYQEQFIHIMVDEFQDTNFAQYELIKQLFPSRERAGSLMVVGDDSQSIYKFRGAAVSNILEFKQDYSNCELITLIKNYRSVQGILDPAYTLIQQNNPDTLEVKLNISKKLVSTRKESSLSPQALVFPELEAEVNFVTAEIEALLAKQPDLSFKDIAILARANHHLDPFVLALRSKQIPYQLIGNRGLYDKEEVKDVLALLRVLASPLDAVSLYRVLSNPLFAVSATTVSRLLSESKFHKLDLWDVVRASAQTEVKQLVQQLESFQKELLKHSPSVFIHKLITELGLLAAYAKEESIEQLLAIKNLNLFLAQAQQFEQDYYQDHKATSNILDFLEYLDLMIEAGDNPAQAEIEDIDTVTLSTVHAAKGLEYQAVFMVNLVSGRFPSRERSDPIEIPPELIKETLPVGDEHLQEERRLFYVAMTRAKNYLYLIHATNYGGKRDTCPSGFIAETGLKATSAADPAPVKEHQTMFGLNSSYRMQILADKPFALDYVSYTQISAYQTCPLKYKYAYVLKLPVRPSYALAFGSTIHDTLRDFHTEHQKDRTINYQRLLELYAKNWDDSGYLDQRHRKQRYTSGEKLLKAYYDKEKERDQNIITLEATVRLSLAGVKFSGRVDRIDRLDGNKVEIIDYKTGKLKDQQEVDKDLQTALYAWGVHQTLNYEPETLSLYFVEALEKVSTHKTPDQIARDVQKAESIVETMKSGDFTATPGYHCEWCDYKDLCPFAQKGV